MVLRRQHIVGTFGLVVMLWLATALLVPLKYPELSDRGLFGDSFGTVNALFSGLALASIVITIFLQREALEQQRREFDLQMDELRESKNALARRVEQELGRARTHLAVALFDEWHSPSMHETRTAVFDFLVNRQQQDETLPSLVDLERTPDANGRQIFRVLHFFEKWALLESTGELDGKLLRRLLAPYTDWWRSTLLDRLEPGEDRHEYVEILRLARVAVADRAADSSLAA